MLMQCFLGRVDVPYLRDKSPDGLRPSDLNPLTNSALERNLSRWAKVYFGNPPGKREQAVSKLLQEIRIETLESLKAQAARREGLSQSAESQEVACSTCQHKNQRREKFCGRCGATLNPASVAVNNSDSAAPQVTAEASAAQSESDVQWLRERSLGSLYASPARVWRGWKYVVGGLIIALAGSTYLQWAPKLQTRMSSPGITTASPATAPEAQFPEGNSSTTAVAPETISSISKAPEIKPSFATANGSDQKTALPGLQPAAQKSSLLVAAPPPQSAIGGDTGDPELRLAQRYLGGSMGVRDSSEAAKLLWKAVRKQNTTAVVLLSDLYLRGDGVPQSCDQARLLLVAATKRGAPQAAEQLRNLESRGCR
jgi:hypothetical protein